MGREGEYGEEGGRREASERGRKVGIDGGGMREGGDGGRKYRRW